MANRRKTSTGLGVVIAIVLFLGYLAHTGGLNRFLGHARDCANVSDDQSCASSSSAAPTPTSASTALPPSTPDAPVSSADPPPVSSQTALDTLDTLTVTDRPKGKQGYNRANDFGDGWSDPDGNGCDTRRDVLVRDAIPGTLTVRTYKGCDHYPVSGQWFDPYTQTVTTVTDASDPQQAQSIQIEHIVPLQEFWLSGAQSWTFQQRELAANDPNNLIVTGTQNQSKGGNDAAAWRPPKAFQCGYATIWINVKATYALTIDQPEKNALEDMLTTCT